MPINGFAILVSKGPPDITLLGVRSEMTSLPASPPCRTFCRDDIITESTGLKNSRANISPFYSTGPLLPEKTQSLGVLSNFLATKRVHEFFFLNAAEWEVVPSALIDR